MSRFLSPLAILLACVAAVSAADPAPTRIFDGKTLAGWEGKPEFFRVEEGAIVAGRLTEKIPRNEFLCTTREYGDFELRLQAKTKGAGVNGGIQFRSKRIPGNHEVIGYQADIGPAIWGTLYDESRRNRYLVKLPKDQAPAIGDDTWATYVIRCEGDRVRLSVNGAPTADWTETDAKVARSGIIGLQIHSGPACEVWYKDIEIVELPAAR